jgi:hypothetical protein
MKRNTKTKAKAKAKAKIILTSIRMRTKLMLTSRPEMVCSCAVHSESRIMLPSYLLDLQYLNNFKQIVKQYCDIKMILKYSNNIAIF